MHFRPEMQQAFTKCAQVFFGRTVIGPGNGKSFSADSFAQHRIPDTADTLLAPLDTETMLAVAAGAAMQKHAPGADSSIREAVKRSMCDFEQNVLPAMSDLRYQVTSRLTTGDVQTPMVFLCFSAR